MKELRLGLIGFPIGHSLSPCMHNAALEALGLRGHYALYPLPPEQFPERFRALLESGVDGLNVTAPHKLQVASLVDHLDPCARRIGAVNTIFRDGESWVGTNTDAEGFLRSLNSKGFLPKNTNAVVLGTGGASRAVLDALATAEVSKLTVVGRSSHDRQDRISAIQKRLPNATLRDSTYGDALRESFKDCDILIQASSATMQEPEEVSAFVDSLPLQLLPGSCLVTDLVYKPLRTLLIQKAEERGLQTQSGEEMLYQQAAVSFSSWTGQPAPLKAMAQALDEALTNLSSRLPS